MDLTEFTLWLMEYMKLNADRYTILSTKDIECLARTLYMWMP